MMETGSKKEDDVETEQGLRDEIADLVDRLQRARERLKIKESGLIPASSSGLTASFTTTSHEPPQGTTTPPISISLSQPSSPDHGPYTNPNQHFLLLLADSALPLGSFAFSSGLESSRAHARLFGARPSSSCSAPWSFEADFLPLSTSALASATLPHVLAAHHRPARLAALDDDLDAATVCAVARRASVAQGRALLGLWDRSFAPGLGDGGGGVEGPAVGDGGGGGGGWDEDEVPAAQVLKHFSALVRGSSSSPSWHAATATPHNNDNGSDTDTDDEEEKEERARLARELPTASGHLAPVFGAVARALGLTASEAAHAYVLAHARAVASAAMRAGALGPFQAQRALAAPRVRRLVADVVRRAWDVAPEDAAAPAPALDLWIARHEVLYSKIFNS